MVLHMVVLVLFFSSFWKILDVFAPSYASLVLLKGLIPSKGPFGASTEARSLETAPPHGARPGTGLQSAASGERARAPRDERVRPDEGRGLGRGGRKRE